MSAHDSTLDEIRDRIDIVDLISEYVSLKKSGQNWKGLCPFHAEKTPSFTVSPSKQIFHCFGCGTGGDIFTFIEKQENLSFPEAMSLLARRAGVAIKKRSASPARAGLKEKILDIHREALSFYSQQLKSNSRAIAYLKDRGIDEEAIERFSLGYAPKSWSALLTHCARKGYRADLMKTAGLAVQGSKGFYDTFRDRIMFPIFDIKGDVIAFGGRSFDGSEPKYLNSPETPIFNKRKVLYGLDRARNAIDDETPPILAEGYMDVIRCHLSGFGSAVAPLGTALNREHGVLLKRYADRVLLAYDSDEAGRRAARNSARILLACGLDVGILSMPAGEDPDSLIREKGGDAFRRLLENPLSIIDFILARGGDRKRLARECLETIANVADSVTQGYYIKSLAERLGINEVFLIEELKKLSQKSAVRKDSPPVAAAGQKRGPGPMNELYLIKLFLQMSDRADELVGMISSNDFSDPGVKKIFEKIREGLFSLTELLEKSGEEEKALLSRISLIEDFENPEKALDDCLRRLRENRRKMLLADIQRRIREAEARKDYVALKTLQQEHQWLLREMKR
jgi:DNA primase